MIGFMIIIILLGPAYSLIMASRDSIRLERKVKEKTSEITESHQRLLTVLDSLDAGVYVTELQTYYILFVNKYTRDLFGDVVGKICWQVMEADRSGPCDICTNIKLSASDINPLLVHTREYYDKDLEKWNEIRDRPITWLDGRIVRLHITSDITDRKRSENDLKQTTKRLSGLLESLPTVPYTCQLNGNFGITYVSNAIKEITGYTADQLVENPAFWSDCIHPNDKERVLAELPEITKHGKQNIEYSFRAADGSYKLMSDIRTLVKLWDGTISHIVGTWQDITEKKRLREVSLNRMQRNERHDFGNIIGISPPMQAVYERISKIIDMPAKIFAWSAIRI